MKDIPFKDPDEEEEDLGIPFSDPFESAQPQEEPQSKVASFAEQAGGYMKEIGMGAARTLVGTVDLVNTLTNSNTRTNDFMEKIGGDIGSSSMTDALNLPERGHYAGDTLAGNVVGLAGEFAAPGGLMAKAGARAKSAMQAASAAVPAGALGEIGQGLYGDAGRFIGETIGGFFSATPANLAIKVKNAEAKQALIDSAPTAENLKNARTSLYRQIDDLGGFYPKAQSKELFNEISGMAFDFGIDPAVHPKSTAVLKKIQSAGEMNMTTKHLDNIRKTAGDVASDFNNPADAEASRRIIGSIDDFMLSSRPVSRETGKELPEINSLYKDAREISRRVILDRKLGEAMDKATRQMSGFENGLRRQFSQLRNNKKFSKGLNSEQKKAMDDIVVGDDLGNISRQLGKFGFGLDQTTNTIRSVVGISGGYEVGGKLGAIAVPILGTLSRNMAEKMTKNNADLARSIVLAGDSAPDIVKGYLRNTPHKERDYKHLAEILARPTTKRMDELKNIGKDPETRSFINNAAFMVPHMQSYFSGEAARQEQEQ